MKIAIVGVGNMGQAIFQALQTIIQPKDIILCEKEASKRKTIKHPYIYTSLSECIENVDVIIIAIKPQAFKKFADEIRDQLDRKFIISIMAGIGLKSLEKTLRSTNIARVMPNLGVQIQKSVSAWLCHPDVNTDNTNLLERIFRSMGQTIAVKSEHQIDAITALSASGLAYYFTMTQHIYEKARKYDFNDDQARIIAQYTCAAAGDLLIYNTLSSLEWKQAVTSPQGTTEAALKVFEEKHFDILMNEAIQAAFDRGRELNQ